MKILNFFVRQFKYQLKNSFNVNEEFSQFEALDYLGFIAILSILPFIMFVLWLIFGMFILKLNLSQYLSQGYIFEIWTLLLIYLLPLVLFIIFFSSYISFLIRCFKYKKWKWVFTIGTIILCNFMLYYIATIKIFH